MILVQVHQQAEEEEEDDEQTSAMRIQAIKHYKNSLNKRDVGV